MDNKQKKVRLICIITALILGLAAVVYAGLFLGKHISHANAVDSCIDQIHATDPEAHILVYDSSCDNLNPVTSALFGYDYIIVSEDDYIPDFNLTLTDIVPSKGSKAIRVFRNPDADRVNGALLLSQGIISWDAEPYSPFSALNKLSSEILGGPEIFEEVEDSVLVLPNPEDKTNPDSVLIKLNFEEPGDYYTSLSHTIHLGEENEGFIYNCPVAKFQSELVNRESSRFHSESYDEFLSKLSESSSAVSVDYSGKKLSIDTASLSSGSAGSDSSDDFYLLIPHSIFTDYPDGYGLFGKDFTLLDSSDSDSIEIIEKDIFGIRSSVIHLRKSSDGTFPTELNISFKSSCRLLTIFICLFVLLIISAVLIIKRRAVAKFIPAGLKTLLYDNRIYIFSVMIGALFWLILSLITRSVPFGTGSAVISDGYIEDYPTATHFIQKVKAFEFYKFDYTLGFLSGGFSLASLTYFLNPFRLILLLFPLEQSLLAYNTLYAVEFILIGPAMIFYLTHRPYGNVMKKTALKLIPISMAYSLSSYMVCYYSFGGFLDIMLILPLIMLAMDRLVYKKKCVFYILILGYYMILSAYFAFLLCEFLLLYFFVLEHKNIKTFFMNGIRFALSSLAAAGLASFTLIPFYRSVMNSGYVENDQNAGSVINVLSQNLLGSLQDMEVMHRTSLATADTTIANTYCGLLVLLIIPLFLFVKNISLSSRIRRLVLIFFLYFSYGNELMNYVLHGFHLQSLVPNRFSLFFIFMMVNVLYDTVQAHRDIFSTKTLLIFAVYSGVILLLMIRNHASIQGCMKSALFIAAYIIIIALGTMNKKNYGTIRLLLLFLTIELSLSAINSFRAFGSTEESEMITQEQAKVIRDLSKEYGLKENGLLRSSIINEDNTNSSCITDINSASIFSSTISQEQLNLAKTFNIYCGTNNIEYGCGNPLADIFLNNQYFFQIRKDRYKTLPSYFEPIESRRKVTMYQNPYIVGSGLLLSEETINKLSEINRADYENCFDYQNQISKAITNLPLYTIIDTGIQIEVSSTSESGETKISIVIPAGIKGDIFLTYGDYIEYLTSTDGTLETSSQTSLPSTVTNYNVDSIIKDIRIAYLNLETLDTLHATLMPQEDCNILGSGNSISCFIKTSSTKSIYLAIPQNQKWNSGNNISEEAISSFLGGIKIECPQGNVTIEIDN